MEGVGDARVSLPAEWVLSRLDDGEVVETAEGEAALTLGALMETCRVLVMDLWTTACTRCPAAMAKMNREAADERFQKHGDGVVFATVNLDDAEMAAGMVDESEWENMQHFALDFETKEAAKAILGFSQVPFCIVVDQSRRVLFAGPPRTLDLGLVEAALEDRVAAGEENAHNTSPSTTTAEDAEQSKAAAAAPAASETPAFVLDEDF